MSSGTITVAKTYALVATVIPIYAVRTRMVAGAWSEGRLVETAAYCLSDR